MLIFRRFLSLLMMMSYLFSEPRLFILHYFFIFFFAFSLFTRHITMPLRHDVRCRRHCHAIIFIDYFSSRITAAIFCCHRALLRFADAIVFAARHAAIY